MTAVLAETYRQLTQSGIGGVSIDEVSKNSGVAKTTIYRHWPSRSALLIDACSRMGNAQAAPDTGSLRGDLWTLASTVAAQLQSAAWPSVLPSIIDAAERDPQIAAMQSALHEGNMAPFYTVVQRAKARGEVAADRPAADVIAATLGPLFYRRWFSKEAIDERFVSAVVDAAVLSEIAVKPELAEVTEAGSPPDAPSRSRRRGSPSADRRTGGRRHLPAAAAATRPE